MTLKNENQIIYYPEDIEFPVLLTFDYKTGAITVDVDKEDLKKYHLTFDEVYDIVIKDIQRIQRFTHNEEVEEIRKDIKFAYEQNRS